MKRALAAALLCALAACSSGGNGSEAAHAVAGAVETTPPTSGFSNDPDEGFARAMESRTGQTGDAVNAAATMVRSMCDMLDTTVASEAAGTLSDAGLQVMFNEWDGSPDELAQVFVLGSENYCPEHKGRIIDYAAEHGISTNG
jgi:hypothetical protein